MTAFCALPKVFSFAHEEEEILQLWESLDAFARSISKPKAANKPPYTFYDGPPFATGLPHYGHMVASSIKDTVARYWTMRGYYVERRFGWDTHGLPVEMETEKALGLLGPQSIREYGIAKFNEACRDGVLKYTKEWRRVITRLGRWVDFDNDYKTMDINFMESVWWVFAQLWQKNLVFKGFRVMPYSVRLSTPLSNFEANLNYQNVQDPAVTIKAKLLDDDNTHLLIWTTTPWTLPANLAIAVGADIEYVKVKLADKYYILAKNLLAQVIKEPHEIVSEMLGCELLDLRYEPIYTSTDYKRALGDEAKKCFRVIASSHVTTDSGTGLVHMAPAFGIDDFAACTKEGMPHFDPLDEEGKFLDLVPDLVSIGFKEADKLVLQKLKNEEKIFARSTIDHSYPFCWRSNTPLIYKAVPVWLIDVPKIKERMAKHNESIHWVPEAVGHKRFANWLKDAADWSISRNRFWGTPIPVWTCNSCGDNQVLGSVAELEAKSGQKISDLHSHFIDGLSFACEKCPGSMSRISEVFDCWFESGSMPVAQIHYPFENQDYFAKAFPADFIAEGLDQTRGWFYTLLVISTGLFDKPPFKNVIVNGMVLAEDGSKMSKSKKNFPDPEFVINEYGADAVRAYLVGSPVVRGEPLLFNEQGIKDVVRSVLLPLYNSWSFFTQYAIIDDFDPKGDLPSAAKVSDRPEIDRWILSKLQSLIASVNSEMNGYYLYKTITPIVAFIDDMTNWYIRRCRRRFWKNAKSEAEKADKLSAYSTLYEVLSTFSKILAPLVPFISENIYQHLVVKTGMNLAGEDSVHLCEFPHSDANKIDIKLEKSVDVIRKVVAMGRALREKYRIKTRQPLKAITVVTHDEEAHKALLEHEELVTSELNVRALKILVEDDTLCKVSCRPNFKTLGPRLGKDMAEVNKAILGLERPHIKILEDGGHLELVGHKIDISDVSIVREALADVVVMSEGHLSVALDTELNDELKDEGLMREALSLLQRLRKEKGLEISDRIKLKLHTLSPELLRALSHHQGYLAKELLASELSFDNKLAESEQTHSLDIESQILTVLLLKV